MMRRLARALAAMLATLIVVAGCGTTASDLPLPGSKVSGETYSVTARFDDALNLAVGAAVKTGGVQIGRVREISVDNFVAVITMDIETDRSVSAGADFRLRSTTALGELFVDVIDDPATTEALADGAEVDRNLTSAAPTVEDTLSAASLFINGGGLGQIQTIVEETNALLGGREDTVRDVLHRLTSTATALNGASSDIDAALIAIADASAILQDREATINVALAQITPAAQTLTANTDSLVGLLSSLTNLSTTLVPVIEQSRTDLLTMLSQAGPVFAEVASIEAEIDEGVATVLTFTDRLDSAVPGTYLNTRLFFQVEVSVGGSEIIGGLLPGGPSTTPQAAPKLPQVPLLDSLIPQTAPGEKTAPDPLAQLLATLTGGGI